MLKQDPDPTVIHSDMFFPRWGLNIGLYWWHKSVWLNLRTGFLKNSLKRNSYHSEHLQVTFTVNKHLGKSHWPFIIFSVPKKKGGTPLVFVFHQHHFMEKYFTHKYIYFVTSYKHCTDLNMNTCLTEQKQVSLKWRDFLKKVERNWHCFNQTAV